jgi:hypothetical protein
MNGRSLRPQRTPGEVEEARPALEDDGVDVILGHQAPRLFDPRAPFVIRDRDDAGGHRFQCTNRGRHRRRGVVVAAAARSIRGSLGQQLFGGLRGDGEARTRGGR